MLTVLLSLTETRTVSVSLVNDKGCDHVTVSVIDAVVLRLSRIVGVRNIVIVGENVFEISLLVVRVEKEQVCSFSVLVLLGDSVTVAVGVSVPLHVLVAPPTDSVSVGLADVESVVESDSVSLQVTVPPVVVIVEDRVLRALVLELDTSTEMV